MVQLLDIEKDYLKNEFGGGEIVAFFVITNTIMTLAFTNNKQKSMNTFLRILGSKKLISQPAIRALLIDS